LPKTRFFWLYFRRRQYGCTFNHFDALKSYAFSVITQSNGYYTPFKVIQSPTLFVPVESFSQ